MNIVEKLSIAALLRDLLADSEMPEKAVSLYRIEDSQEKMILTLAAQLASGGRSASEPINMMKSTSKRIVSIFSRIESKERHATQYHKQTENNDFKDDAFLPVAESEGSANLELWKSFVGEAHAIVNTQADTCETWLSLLRQYATRIPAAMIGESGNNPTETEISIYDQAHITAAFASCLALFPGPEGIASWMSEYEQQQNTSKPWFKLVSGDISGIQDFLYSIASARATRTLKGRSFFISLLGEILADSTARSLGLTPANIIYSGGGRFYIIAPGNADILKLSNQLEKNLFSGLHGALQVFIAEAPVSLEDLIKNNFAEVWSRVGQAVARKKQARFSRLAKLNYDDVFSYIDQLGEDQECDVCGRPSMAKDLTSDDDGGKCARCEDFEKLGSKLLRGQYAVISTASSSRNEKMNLGLSGVFAKLGFSVHIISDKAEIHKISGIVRIVQIRNGFQPVDIIKILPPDGRISLTYHHAGIHTPESSNNPRGVATFEELAEQSEGDKKLGLLRADVDDLGQLFMGGLGKEATPARMATLSRSLADYFGWRIPSLLKKEKYRDCTYIIYSGGDDLFIVGAWSALAELAQQIQSDFYSFTCGCCSLSAGLVVTDPKFPLKAAAIEAQKAEDSAKHFVRFWAGGKEKSALCFLGETVGWEELRTLNELYNSIVHGLTSGFVDQDKLPRSFLQRLFQIYEIYEREKQGLAAPKASTIDLVQLAQWTRWRWMLVYSLRRFNKSSPEIQGIITKLCDVKTTPSGRPVMTCLGMPLRCAELITRGGQNG